MEIQRANDGGFIVDYLKSETKTEGRHLTSILVPTGIMPRAFENEQEKIF